MLPECEFGFEHSLSLQSSTLSDEQVVVVSLERSFVNIKHFVPQVEGHAVARIGRLKAWKAQSTSSLQYNNPNIQLDIIHTCHQTILQCVHCSLVFHYPPHLSWLSTELCSPPVEENNKIAFLKTRNRPPGKTTNRFTFSDVVDYIPLVWAGFVPLHPAFLHPQIHPHSTEDQRVYKGRYSKKS